MKVLRKSKKGGLWEYLDSLGILEKGTEEQIRQAKREYRKKYYTEFKRKQRVMRRDVTISLNKNNGEFGKLALAAKNHERTLSAFLKEAALAYLNQSFVVPDKLKIAQLELILSQYLNEVKQIVKGKERFFWDREAKFEKIEQRIIELQNKISIMLRYPPLLHSDDHQNQIPQESNL